MKTREFGASRRLAVIRTTCTTVVAIGLLATAPACKDDDPVRVCDPTVETGTTVDTTEPDDTTVVVEDTVEDTQSDTVEDTLSIDTRVPPQCPWTRYDEGLVGGPVGNIQFDPRAPGVAYVSAGSLMYRSTDAGREWALHSQRETSFGKLSFPPGDIKRIYSGSAAGLLESTDSGATFSVKALGGLQLYAIVAHDAAPQKLFVGTWGGGIMRSNNEGAGFIPRNVGVARSQVNALVSDPRDASVVIAGTIGQSDVLGYTPDGQILRTTNSGDSWTAVVESTGWVYEVKRCAADPDVLYAATKTGLIRSSDAGLTWGEPVGFAGEHIYNIGLAGTDCDTVYAMIFQDGMYRSYDGGRTIEGPFTEGLTLQPSRMRAAALAVDPTDSTRIFAATHAGLMMSEDSAETWSLQVVADGIAVTELVSSVSDGPRAWLGTWGSGLWTRADPDDVWHRTTLPQDFIYSITGNPNDADNVYVGGIDRLWQTTADTEGFLPLDPRGNVTDQGFPTDSSAVYITTQTLGVQRSLDAGVTFTAVNGDLQPWATPAGTFIDTRSILVDPSDGQRIVVGTNGRGVIRTLDGGTTWAFGTAIPDGHAVTRLARDPGPPERLYALVQNRGVYRSEDWGETWTLSTVGLESLELRDLVIDDQTGHLYLAVAGQAVFQSIDGGETWDAFDRYCLPNEGFAELTVVDWDGGRYLLAARSNNRIWRHALGD